MNECQYRDCDGQLLGPSDDPLLPDYINLWECDECGEVYEEDTEDGEITVHE